MAYYISSPTTFCEVTYDSDWLNFDRDDRHLTPYRYSLLRNDTDTNSDTVSLTLPSYTYYEYLRSLYDCRSTPTRVPPPGYAGPPGSHIGQQGRSVTWHAFNKDNASELSRQAVKSEPTRIRPTYPFPSLHLIQGGDSGDELDDEYAYADRSKEKLVWVDALNKWVPQKQLHPRPYMSFVGNVPVLEKHGKLPREIAGGGWESEGVQTCERFEMHMGQRTSVSQPQDKSRLRNNEKREAIRKRAQELAEQKKQRKAYSTPLYTSLTERKQNLKPHIQSSRHHSSLPVSPVQRKEKIPSPKEVWQARDHSITEKRPSPSPVPMKREISIKLVSPTPEDEVKDEEDDKDKLSEKKVTFIDEGEKTTPKSSKKKKDEDADSINSADKEEEMRLEEQRLIESLEKQRLLQQQEQQKLLEEEQRKEKERKEKERIAEEERLKKMKESHNMHKQPLSTQNQNHDNYYENTMNAADLIFSQNSQDKVENEGKINKSKTKTEELNLRSESQKTEAISSGDNKNDLKNNKSKEITSNSADIIPIPPKTPKSTEKLPKMNDKSKMKSSSSKSSDFKKTQSAEKSKNAVKIPDGLGRIEEGLEREGTTDNVKVSHAKRKKGKAKTQSKPVKVEKAPKKPVKKVVEEKPQEQMQKVIPKPKPEPPSKPILAGIGAHQKPVKAMAQGVKPEMKVSEEKLPVSKPADIEPVTEEEIIKPKSPATERGKSNVEQKEIVKKEKRDGRKCVKKSEETTKPLPELEVDAKKVDPWIFDQDDFSEKKDLGKEDLQVEIEPLPVLSGDLNPELIEKEKKERKENKRKSVLASLIGSEKTIKKWRKPGHLDSSYADELRRLELAEERRKRQMEMFERLKNRRVSNFSDAFDDGSPRFEDCKIKSRPMSGECGLDFDDGFLAKYCIFTKGNIEMYRHAFDAVDEGSSGWLEGEDVMIALRGVNNKLTEAEEEYLYRVLELTGYKLTHGADFKIFSVLAALSQRISALDKWMKNLIGKMDFKALEMKMFKCKTLWECNVDKDTNSISIDQLCVDLRAGGVSYEHETEVREKLAHLHAIDLLDFLTYIPLFIMIHESVVRNPLDDTRNK